MRVTYMSQRTNRPVTVTGVEVDGRYPNMYLTLDTPEGVLRIPRDVILKPRCYMEFCCNEATFEVELLDRSINRDQEPIPWGWCNQHKHLSWTQRKAQK